VGRFFPRDDAVVHSELRVHGLRGLRVADASVMPSIISGPTNALSFMIGGRAAELIKAAT
jgi:choline dehydrogenase